MQLSGAHNLAAAAKGDEQADLTYQTSNRYQDNLNSIDKCSNLAGKPKKIIYNRGKQ